MATAQFIKGFVIIYAVLIIVQSARSQHCVPALVITNIQSEAGSCLATHKEVENLHQEILNSFFAPPQCGDGLWYQVAYLNMSDPTHQCPSNWTEFSNKNLGVRACRRQSSIGNGSCSGVFFPSSKQQYRKVCGKVIGYQFGTTDAFASPYGQSRVVKNYIDGVSITHGVPRNHIWSFASGVTEFNISSIYSCPCSHNYRGPTQHSFVGNHYFCESGNPNRHASRGTVYPDDKLWDGQQCSHEGTCCTSTSLPYFIRELPNPTSDDIEVRICGDEGTETEGTPVELVQIYVQ